MILTASSSVIARMHSPGERPETSVTFRTGHMGNTFRFRAGGVNALEREFGDERAPALCRPPARRAFARMAPSDTVFGGDAGFNKCRWIVHDVAYGFL